MNWFGKQTPAVLEPEATPEDPLAAADRAYRAANDEWLTAWTEVRRYYAQHRREHGRKQVGDRVYDEITLDPELTRIASRENHARIARDNALDHLDKLKPKPHETRHIAGVKV
jgi:hypothetical protein